MKKLIEKIKSKNPILLFLAVMFFSAAGIASAQASTVTRSFSNASPVAGTPLTVSLAVSVAAPDTFYIIDEIIPAGWIVSNPGTGDTTQPGHIKWAVLSGAVSATNQYAVTVPTTASGPSVFSGEFAFDSNLVPAPILGETTVNVQQSQVAPVLTSVSVTPASASLAPAATQQLSAQPMDQNGTPFVGAAVTWASSDTAIATVDANGLVAGVAAGQATVTATAVSGAVTVSGTSNITVAAPVPQGTSTVTRSFDNATPLACSPLGVSLSVNVAAPDTFYIIDEVLPAGWIVSNPGTGDTTQPGHIKWAVLSGAVSATNQYAVTVPCGASGPSVFSGEFAFDSNLVPAPILGATTVNVTRLDTSLSLNTPAQWTIFSAPRKLSSLQITAADIDSILAFDGATQQFAQITDPADPQLFNPLNAFFLKPNKATSIGFTFAPVLEPLELMTKSLFDGWNLIGANNSSTAENEFSSIQTTIGHSGMVTFQAPQTFNARKSLFADFGANADIDLNANPIVNLPDVSVSPFDGYWVSMNGADSYSKFNQ